LPINGSFFKEFVVECPLPPKEVNDRLLEKGILGGIDLSNHFNNGMMLCVTEMSTRASIEKLVQELYDISL